MLRSSTQALSRRHTAFGSHCRTQTGVLAVTHGISPGLQSLCCSSRHHLAPTAAVLPHPALRSLHVGTQRCSVVAAARRKSGSGEGSRGARGASSTLSAVLDDPQPDQSEEPGGEIEDRELHVEASESYLAVRSAPSGDAQLFVGGVVCLFVSLVGFRRGHTPLRYNHRIAAGNKSRLVKANQSCSRRTHRSPQYAMSVIVGRALPDVRDGLKPVHRRIL